MATIPELHASAALLFTELTQGPPPNGAYVLNGGDPGLLAAIDRLSAEAASHQAVPGAASIAAHVDHVCYGLDLLNRWADGEANPWQGADWSASWRRLVVNGPEWAALRQRLRQATARWLAGMQMPRDLSSAQVNEVIGSIAHLAYHFGAIRQMDRSIQGPKAP